MFRIESVEIIRISSGSKAIAELLSLEPIGAEDIKLRLVRLSLLPDPLRCLPNGTKRLAYFSAKVVFALYCSNMMFV